MSVPVEQPGRRGLHDLVDGHPLSPAQRRIARHVLEHPEDGAFLTAMELATRAGVSQPSVTRFAVALGFAGYPELRDEIRARVFAREHVSSSENEPGESLLHRALTADAASLQQLAATIGSGAELRRVGEALASSRPLPVVGARVSRHFAELFAYFAQKVHPDVRVVPSGSAGEDALAQARRAGATTLLAFGLPRYPSELLRALQWARRIGLRIALLTDSPLSPLAVEADDVLAASVASELVFDSPVAPLALSMALLQTMVDALPADAQRWLEEFDQHAAERQIFLS